MLKKCFKVTFFALGIALLKRALFLPYIAFGMNDENLGDNFLSQNSPSSQFSSEPPNDSEEKKNEHIAQLREYVDKLMKSLRRGSPF